MKPLFYPLYLLSPRTLLCLIAVAQKFVLVCLVYRLLIFPFYTPNPTALHLPLLQSFLLNKMRPFCCWLVLETMLLALILLYRRFFCPRLRSCTTKDGCKRTVVKPI